MELRNWNKNLQMLLLYLKFKIYSNYSSVFHSWVSIDAFHLSLHLVLFREVNLVMILVVLVANKGFLGP